MTVSEISERKDEVSGEILWNKTEINGEQTP